MSDSLQHLQEIWQEINVLRKRISELEHAETSVGTYTDEEARDAIGTALTDGNGIAKTVSDPSDTITLALTTLTSEWDIGENMSIRAERLEARDVEGLRIEDDGGNLGVFIKDGGFVGIMQSDPNGPLQVKGQAASPNNTLFLETNTFTWLSAGSLLRLGHGAASGNTYAILENLHSGGAATGGAVAINPAGGRAGVGPNATAPRGRFDVDQDSATGAIPALVLDQADLDQPFIEFVTTIGTGNAVEAVGAKVLTTTHFIMIKLPGGLTRYLPAGTIA